LDSAAAEKVAMILQQLRAAGKTVVIAAHDSSLVSIADQVITLRRGEVISIGPAAALRGATFQVPEAVRG
jgi:ABC-type lipoprotein export system ATPase subunit